MKRSKKPTISKNWKDLSIETLEGQSYGVPLPNDSGLILRCKDFSKLPIKTLDAEQLRTLIGQNIGLPFLIPLALDLLAENILTEGDLYPGDLLTNVSHIEHDFWMQNPELFAGFKLLLRNMQSK